MEIDLWFNIDRNANYTTPNMCAVYIYYMEYKNESSEVKWRENQCVLGMRIASSFINISSEFCSIR